MLRLAIICIIVEAAILGFLIGCYYGYKQATRPVPQTQPAITRSIDV